MSHALWGFFFTSIGIAVTSLLVQLENENKARRSALVIILLLGVSGDVAFMLHSTKIGDIFAIIIYVCLAIVIHDYYKEIRAMPQTD